MDRLNYFDAADLPTIRRDYPLGEAFEHRFAKMSRDELRNIQNERFARVMLAFAWKVPFYRRLWGKAGIEAGRHPKPRRSRRNCRCTPSRT